MAVHPVGDHKAFGYRLGSQTYARSKCVAGNIAPFATGVLARIVPVSRKVLCEALDGTAEPRMVAAHLRCADKGNRPGG